MLSNGFRVAPKYLRRNYALSRFQNRPTGVSRTRQPLSKRPDSVPPNRFSETSHESESSDDTSRPWHTSKRPPTSDSEERLHALLMGHKALTVERQIEMLNIFIGFEQCNKYTINNEAGNTVGYIAEEEGGILATISRQAFATHRPFRAVIMDASGSPVLWVRRPFAWINSRMYAQKLQHPHKEPYEGEPVLDTFGEVQQIWHPWRRRYDVFLREKSRRILSAIDEEAPAVESETPTYAQFAKVDSGFLSWEFPLFDSAGREIAFISRAFRGFGRELFTDTGQYTIGFSPMEHHLAENQAHGHAGLRDMTLDERAVILALAVNIDFDYFSHHSHAGSGGLFHFYDGE
ncbi:Scramblase-domain-containing protein [Amanita rubescens]|nr:Scramblase-domain-containing protein [Amanita rubescens]